jgi:hypothetical protein
LQHPVLQQELTQQESQQQRSLRLHRAEAESTHSVDTVNNTKTDISNRRMTNASS